MAGTLLQATFVNGGSVTVDDSIAVTAISTLSSAVTANTAQLTLVNTNLIGLLGTTASKTYPGGLTAVAAAQEVQLKEINVAITKQTEAMEKLITAVNKIANSIDTSTTGMANIQHTLTKQVTTQQMVAADTIKNNKFTQATTNAALVDAGKPPTVVKPDDMKASVLSAVQDISLINAQSQGAALIETAVTESVTQGFKISTEWLAQTAFGKWVTDNYAIAKLQTKILFADEKTERELRKQLADIKSATLNPAGAGGGK